MQSTGLCDSKGVEIFEGDLLAITDPRNDCAAKGCAEVVFSHGYVGGWVASSDGKNTLNIGTRTAYVEVVGNIHANPELLKEKL